MRTSYSFAFREHTVGRPVQCPLVTVPVCCVEWMPHLGPPSAETV
uniref:Uncharacterized protein n=1 Tax=Anguilla anguilla TaxID=7936 RepID=A0A0E9S3G4_ANGAN